MRGDHWLETQREKDIDELYQQLRIVEVGVGGRRDMATCSGGQNWPSGGLYFFFEPGEARKNGEEARVVRVGESSALWNRMMMHRAGNHRSSIFRRHIGAALAGKHSYLRTESWGPGQSADAEVRSREVKLEQAVSSHIATMQVLWLAVGGQAGPLSDRAYLERNIIGLLAGSDSPLDSPSSGWLGRFSPDRRIRESGLWNLRFLEYSYSRDFLNILKEYVLITTGKLPAPAGSLAPHPTAGATAARR